MMRGAPGMDDATAVEMSKSLIYSLALLLAADVLNGSAQRATTAGAAKEKEKAPAVGAEIRNVVLHLGNGVVLDVRELDGKLLSRRAGSPPVFDDIQSYEIAIDHATVSMAPDSLTSLMNNYVFADPKAPIKGSKVTIENGQLKQSGTLHKGVAIPFTATASVGVSSDGWIRIHPTSLKAAGFLSKRVLDFFGLDLERLLKSNPEPGVRIELDDILLNPERLLPPPQVRGHLTKVWIEAGRMFQQFDSGVKVPPTTRPNRTAKNYMYYYGATLRFGKLTMVDTDLQLIDADPKDPFDFSPERYNEQLVAGYSKNTPNHGLMVFMPDLNDLPSRPH
jgi:hypothetical protein